MIGNLRPPFGDEASNQCGWQGSAHRRSAVRGAKLVAGRFVIAGLVPAISTKRAQCADHPDGRDKPGQDQVGTAMSFASLMFRPANSLFSQAHSLFGQEISLFSEEQGIGYKPLNPLGDRLQKLPKRLESGEFSKNSLLTSLL
jgi:hypothetical protein